MLIMLIIHISFPDILRYTEGLVKTNLARTILTPNANVRDGISDDEKGWTYVRPGDFVVKSKHVAYARDRAIVDDEKIVVELPTIEAGGDIPVRLPNGTRIGTRGMTDEWVRTRERDRIDSYLPRRWIAQ